MARTILLKQDRQLFLQTQEIVSHNLRSVRLLK